MTRVEKLRRNKFFTQKELAEKANISQATISYIENGDKSPTERTLKKLATALDVDIMELIQSESEARANG